MHHPVKLAESPTPEWLTIPERGLYTGVAIFGAVGSGKTSACMHPFARQLLSWQADNLERRAAALVLEVKGDFCHDIRRMLTELNRGGDYIELSLDGRLTWNPLSATWLDAYSLAYTVASLLNQLFGKGKEPFWQQAYTNLVRWIIELYRVLPPPDGSDTPGWVTLRDVYHCAIDKALFAKKIEQAQTYAKELGGEWITIAAAALTRDHVTPLRAVGFQPHPADPDRFRARPTTAVFEYLTTHTITHARERFESAHATEDPAPGRSRASLVCPRLEHPRQQDPVEHRGRRLRVPQHVRLAEPSRGCFARPRPTRRGSQDRPARSRPTRTARTPRPSRRSP